MHLGETSHCIAETDPSGDRGVSRSSSLVIHIRYPSRRFHPQHFYGKGVFIQWFQFKGQHEIQHKVCRNRKHFKIQKYVNSMQLLEFNTRVRWLKIEGKLTCWDCRWKWRTTTIWRRRLQRPPMEGPSTAEIGIIVHWPEDSTANGRTFSNDTGVE